MAGTTITAKEAAKRLGITTRTLWRWVDAGKLRDAPNAGRSRMFYADEVDALARKKRGVPTVADLSLLDVYVRLLDAQEWEDVLLLKAEIEAAICAHAEDKTPLDDSYRAATSMAATHPEQDARERWAQKARQYGEWLGIPAEDVDGTIASKAREASFTTYEAARAEMEAAPSDPAQAIAQRARG